MENILWLLLGHYILDYSLQGEFLAQTKGLEELGVVLTQNS